MKKLLFMSYLLIFLQAIYAQGLSIDKVKTISLRNTGAIKEGTDVKGYYFFYVTDKVDSKTNAYSLSIYDNNLKLLKDITFEDSKDVRLLESSFNGIDLMFLLYNSKERTFEYQVYGTDGNKKPFSYTRELTKKEKNYLNETYFAYQGDDEGTYKGLYPIEGKGFISNMPSREDKDFTFQIDYFSSEKKKQWSYTPTEGGKRFLGDYLGTYNGVVYIEVLRTGGMFDQNPDSYILGLNLETGKKIFEKETDSKYRFYPANLSIMNGGKAYLYGEYFDLNGNIYKDKSKGFGFWGIDETGKILSEKYCSWELDMGKYLNVSSSGKIEDFGFMYLHNIIQTSDGSIYAIGEGYKKVASALGIAATVLTRRSTVSTVKIKVTDMMLLKFDKNFNVKEAKDYDKNSSSIELQGGSEFLSTPLIGKMVKYYYDGFDYAYTQTNKDVSAFTVCYSNYAKGKDYKGATFNSINYNEGKITTDHINTKTNTSRCIVLPGKEGQVLLLEYYKKDKRLDAHFEKLN